MGSVPLCISPGKPKRFINNISPREGCVLGKSWTRLPREYGVRRVVTTWNVARTLLSKIDSFAGRGVAVVI